MKVPKGYSQALDGRSTYEWPKENYWATRTYSLSFGAPGMISSSFYQMWTAFN